MNNDATTYLTVSDTAEAEITEKKSRFIATVLHIESEEEATAVLADFRKRYWDARHNCYAYVLGKKSELERFSDDGEPSGTAGRPILEVIKGRGLTNTMIIVTRYFGGILLGTGGLSRAYAAAAADALKHAESAVLYFGQRWQIIVSYSDYARLDRLLDALDIARGETSFETDVTQEVFLLPDQEEEFLNQLAELTAGGAVAEKTGDVSFLRQEKRALLREVP